MSFSVALVKFTCSSPIRMQKLLLVYYHSKNRSTSRIWKVIPNMFFPRFGGGNGGVLSMRMQVILDSLFARTGSAPIYGAGREESLGTGLISPRNFIFANKLSVKIEKPLFYIY